MENTTVEKITVDGDEDAWVCVCGNTPSESGFYPCLETGERVEPLEGGCWVDLSYCAECGRVIRQGTLEVVRGEDEAVVEAALKIDMMEKGAKVRAKNGKVYMVVADARPWKWDDRPWIRKGQFYVDYQAINPATGKGWQRWYTAAVSDLELVEEEAS